MIAVSRKRVYHRREVETVVASTVELYVSEVGGFGVDRPGGWGNPRRDFSRDENRGHQ